MTMKGHVVVTFNVHKDGRITDLQVVKPSSVDAFTNSAHNALAASNPTVALPPEYPTTRRFSPSRSTSTKRLDEGAVAAQPVPAGRLADPPRSARRPGDRSRTLSTHIPAFMFEPPARAHQVHGASAGRREKRTFGACLTMAASAGVVRTRCEDRLGVRVVRTSVANRCLRRLERLQFVFRTDDPGWPHRAADLMRPRRRWPGDVGAVPLLDGRRLGARRCAAQQENGHSDSSRPTSFCVIRQAADQPRRSERLKCVAEAIRSRPRERQGMSCDRFPGERRRRRPSSNGTAAPLHPRAGLQPSAKQERWEWGLGRFR